MTTIEATPRSRFRADGYVKLPNFFGGEVLKELGEQVDRFHREVLPRLPDAHVFHESKGRPETLKQIQQMNQHDPWFDALISRGRVRALAELLLDGLAVPRNVQYFNKPAGLGKGTPPHQDGFYFMLEPCEALTIWIALDEVDEANGCIRYVRGSHTSGLREHARTETLGFSQGIRDYPTASDKERETPVPAQPGDLLAHHALTIHRANGNLTQTRQRRALGLIYYGAEAREDTAAHLRYQRELAGRMRAEGKI